jgi:hypothetical protein
MRHRYLEGRRKRPSVLLVWEKSGGFRSETSLAVFSFGLIRLLKQRERRRSVDTKKGALVDYICRSYTANYESCFWTSKGKIKPVQGH